MHRPGVAGMLLAAAAALWWLRSRQLDEQLVDVDQAEAPEPETDYTAPLFGAWGWTMEQLQPFEAEIASNNEQAFLRAIRVAEGTAGPNGYRTLFGGKLFSSYADHPRIAVQFTDRAGRTLWTTAAGAYQFMAVSPIPGSTKRTRMDTWDRLKRKLGLIDFGPASQDAAALELIDEAGALYDVRAGRFAAAIDKVRKVWASLPGAGYDQPERSLASLQSAYLEAGGNLA